MAEAFILINCESGKEKQVVEHLSAIQTVKEAQATVGVFDVIAKLESSAKKDIDEAIRSKILKFKPINCALKLETE